MRQAVCN